MYYKGDSVRDCSDCKATCGEHPDKVQCIADLHLQQALQGKDIQSIQKEVKDMKIEQSEVLNGLLGVKESMNKVTWVVLGATGIISFLYTFHDPIIKLLGLVK